MRPERWKRIDDLLEAALERPSGERPAFLDRACAGDEDLRREVDLLLAFDRKRDGLLESPAIAAAARLIAETEVPTAAGQRIGRYKILSRIGAGGMGEVYLAEDTQLRRRVALKLLPVSFSNDGERVRRFEQEARAAARLAHPNVCIIHEVGQADNGCHFIAMEYVEGETLRQRLARGRLGVDAALDVGLQVARALAAAHAAGIVHRDVKPENIVLRSDGYAKVLDFGLAKLVEPVARTTSVDTAATNTSAVALETETGVVMGTASYMSPEQARGLRVDQRSDIFSFGAVLYEMLAGEVAFARESFVDTLHAIIHEDPPKLSEARPEAGTACERLVSHCMEKDPERRFQSASDLVFAIEALSEPTRSKPAVRLPRVPVKRLWPAAAAVALVAATAAITWTVSRSSTAPEQPWSLADVTLTPLTTDPGYEGEPSFSPDGLAVAYVSDRTGNLEIFLKQVSGGPDVNLTNNSADDVQPSFAPDGKSIAFVSSRSGTSDVHFPMIGNEMHGGDVWVMPALGGSARRIAESGNFPSWSSDSSELLYVSGPFFRQRIMRVSASGGEPRELPITLGPATGNVMRIRHPKFSPDMRWIVFYANDIFVVRAEGGEAKVVTKGQYPTWSPDSRAIIYSNPEPGRNHSLWRVEFSSETGTASGDARPLTVGRGRDAYASISPDGKRIAFTALEETANLASIAFDAETGRSTGTPRPLTDGKELILNMSFSPDGSAVAYQVQRGASMHIWRLDRGGSPVQLTSDPAFRDTYPEWSPDGSTIAFLRVSANDPRARASVWLMAADGANPRLVVPESSGCGWLPDGRQLAYFSLSDRQIHVVDLSSKQTRRVTDEPGIFDHICVSPDGKWIVYRSTAEPEVDLRAISIDGGPSHPIPSTLGKDAHPFFSPSGRWLYFQPDHKNLYRVPGPAQGWRATAPERVTDFPSSGLYLEDPQASPDGRELIFARGLTRGDVWVMEFGGR
jgi:eukaryotic-like serine/threonine-protein kinase